jgi:hypothetical protein
MFKESRERERMGNGDGKVPKRPNLSEQDAKHGSKGEIQKEKSAVPVHLLGSTAQMFDHLSMEHVLLYPSCSLTGYSVNEEVQEMELKGSLPPLMGEKEPVGAYTLRPVPVTYTQRNWPELARKEMLELRAKNDAALAALEARL